MSRQDRLPHHPGILLNGQQRTGVNEVHGYEVLHPTILLSPAFPDGATFHRNDAIQRTLAHLIARGLPLFTELPRALEPVEKVIFGLTHAPKSASDTPK